MKNDYCHHTYDNENCKKILRVRLKQLQDNKITEEAFISFSIMDILIARDAKEYFDKLKETYENSNTKKN